MTLAIEGPSGAGKSTLARDLTRALGAVLVDEAYERVRPRPSLDFGDAEGLMKLEARLQVEEGRRYREAESFARAGRNAVLDTACFGPLTYTAGLAAEDAGFARTGRALLRAARRSVAASTLGLPDRVLYLDVPVRTAAHRSAARSNPPSRAMVERHARIGRFERALWMDGFAPIARDRWVAISGTGRVGEVLDAALRAIGDRPSPPPAPRALAQEWIDRIQAGYPRSGPVPARGPRAVPATAPRRRASSNA